MQFASLTTVHSAITRAYYYTEEFGVIATTNQIARFRVDCASTACLSKAPVEAHDAARQAFLHNEQAAPIMHKSYRAGELQWMYERARSAAPIVAARMLEQAARESDVMFVRPTEFGPQPSNDLINAEIQREIDFLYGADPEGAK